MIKSLSCLVLCVSLAANCFGWSTKEHIQLTRIAAEQLILDPETPAAMKEWLKSGIAGGPQTLDEEKEYLLHKHVGQLPRGVDGLAFWSVMPDMVGIMDREKVVEPLGVPEPTLHYIDVEY